jgi:hypothetical protein
MIIEKIRREVFFELAKLPWWWMWLASGSAGHPVAREA